MSKGKIIQVIGPVVDFQFDSESLPNQGDAIKLTNEEGKVLVFETFQHLGNDIVRTVSMGSTDGLVRGMEGTNTKAPITVPVGKETLGRIINVTGDPIDFDGEINAKESLPIFFACAVLSIVIGVDSFVYALCWIIFRIAYVFCYVYKLNPYRSIVWMGSIVCLVLMAINLIL